MADHGNKRRGIRHVLNWFLIIALIAQWFMLLTGGALAMGAFHKNMVMNSLAKSSYYKSIYDDLKVDTEISLALVGVPLSIMDQAVTYETVVLAAKQQVENDLEQGNFKADTKMLTGKLENNIKDYLLKQEITLTPQAEVGLEYLIKRLDTKYEALLKWPFSPHWLRLRSQFNPILQIGIPILVLLIGITHFVLIGIQHYRYRGVRFSSFGVLAASLGVLSVSSMVLIYYKNNLIQLSPRYMQEFVQNYIPKCAMIGIFFSAIGMLIALGLFMIAKAMKERRN